MTNFSDVINNTISFSDFNKGQAGKIFQKVKESGAKLVMKNNQPECVLISPAEYLEMVDQYNDLLLLLEAVERMQDEDSSDYFTQDEVNRIFGFTNEELQDNEEVEIE